MVTEEKPSLIHAYHFYSGHLRDGKCITFGTNIAHVKSILHMIAITSETSG